MSRNAVRLVQTCIHSTVLIGRRLRTYCFEPPAIPCPDSRHIAYKNVKLRWRRHAERGTPQAWMQRTHTDGRPPVSICAECREIKHPARPLHAAGLKT